VEKGTQVDGTGVVAGETTLVSNQLMGAGARITSQTSVTTSAGRREQVIQSRIRWRSCARWAAIQASQPRQKSSFRMAPGTRRIAGLHPMYPQVMVIR